LVWVNPPNRFKYTVISHVRNDSTLRISKMFNREDDSVVAPKYFLPLHWQKKIDYEFNRRLNSCD
jgi:hypothetical protein